MRSHTRYRVRHREHQLLRHHRPGRVRVDAVQRLTPEQLPFYRPDASHWRQPAALPRPGRLAPGQSLSELQGKPAALVTRLPGQACMKPSALHCAAIGRVLARLHQAAASYPAVQPNLRGLDWWRHKVPELVPHVPVRVRRLLEDELSVQSTFAASAGYARLPRAAVHADLFRDNVLFTEEATGPQVGGVIDFYFAGIDTLMFDLAVTVNDWCTDDRLGSFETDRLQALLSSYTRMRPVTRDESLAWPFALRAAALRFWVSRLDDSLAPRPAETLTPKDPAHFERMLVARRQDAVTAGQALLAQA
ncbi:MAG: homoserine kinase [Burkholderiaceae bacterium]